MLSDINDLTIFNTVILEYFVHLLQSKYSDFHQTLDKKEMEDKSCLKEFSKTLI